MKSTNGVGRAMSAEGIAIVLTGLGPAAIAVVRLSGPGVESFLQKHFTRPVAIGRCVHGDVIDGQRVIDDVIVALGPKAAWADVNLHGGSWVVRRFMELAARAGFDAVHRLGFPLPDEAVDADSPLEREALSHLPLARTELGVRILLGQPHAWARLKKQRLTGDVSEKLRRIARDATLRHLLNPPRVAIVGVANVGKSTLANQLFGQERSITADVAGTTRDWVGEVANVDGLPVVLVDTPGLRQTDDPIEQTAIAQSRTEIEVSSLVILVLDATRPLGPDQAALMERFPKALLVTNKSDRPKVWDASSIQSVRTVATTGEGVRELRDRIIRYFCGDPPSPDRVYCWTERQRQIIAQALDGAPDALVEL